MLPKQRRIKQSREIQHLVRKGKVISTTNLTVHYTYNAGADSKFAVITSKKIGPAHLRNQIRRQIYRQIRLHQVYSDITGWQIVIIPRSSINDLTSSQLDTLINDILTKISADLSV